MMNCDENGIPRIGSPWVHKKNKISYTVYDITNAEADPGRNEEYPITVSYIGMNGKKWSKSLANFLDRMEPSPDAWGFVPILQVPSALSAEAWKRAFAQGEDAGNMHERVAAQIVEHEDFRALLFSYKHGSAVLCCVPTARDMELLNSGEYTPEELWGGSRPTCPACINADKPAKAKTPWVPYLVDRADGVAGHYAIGRWNPAGYQEVWNLWKHCWGSASEDVLTYDEAMVLMKSITVQERTLKSKEPQLKSKPFPVLRNVPLPANAEISKPLAVPVKINVLFAPENKPTTDGAWYYVTATPISTVRGAASKMANHIRKFIFEGVRTHPYGFGWSRVAPSVLEQLAVKNINVVTELPGRGVSIVGEFTIPGGNIQKIAMLAYVLRAVCHTVNKHRNQPMPEHFIFMLEKIAQDALVAYKIANNLRIESDGWSIRAVEGRVIFDLPMSILCSEEGRFDISVVLSGSDCTINLDDRYAALLDAVVSLDWILLG